MIGGADRVSARRGCTPRAARLTDEAPTIRVHDPSPTRTRPVTP